MGRRQKKKKHKMQTARIYRMIDAKPVNITHRFLKQRFAIVKHIFMFMPLFAIASIACTYHPVGFKCISGSQTKWEEVVLDASLVIDNSARHGRISTYIYYL